MTLPTPLQVQRLLGRLLGDSPVLQKDARRPEVKRIEPSYASVCLDDNGRPVAVMVADLHAALFLGGKLMRKPMGGLEDEAEAGQASDGVVDALSEVFNNLTICFNQIKGNPHIRSQAADAGPEVIEASDWAEARRVDLTGDFLKGSGRLVLLAK